VPARWDLRGGPGATSVPTAIENFSSKCPLPHEARVLGNPRIKGQRGVPAGPYPAGF